MNQRFAYLMAAGLALAAGPHAVISASPQGHSVAVGDVDIIVDGARQPRYAHEGRWYVEARKGREYAIQLRNPYPVRVAVALSVDGLNTIDARETTAAAGFPPNDPTSSEPAWKPTWGAWASSRWTS